MRGRPIHGVLLLDKPAGPSSNQALQCVKRLFGAAKAGHAGTLDPFAAGLLPIFFGEATKFASFSSDAVKCYEASIILGRRTDTGDTTGVVLEERPAQVIRQEIEIALRAFLGRQLQTPPMYSALKRSGEPLYRLARRGEVVSRSPREIEIRKLELRELRSNSLDVVVECTKGTYIRVLAEDLGERLGCGGTLGGLRRTRVGDFRLERAYALQMLQSMKPDQLAEVLLPLDAALVHLPCSSLGAEQMGRIRQGQRIELRGSVSGCGLMRLYEEASGRFLGLGLAEEGWLRPQRLVGSGEFANSVSKNGLSHAPATG